MLFEYLGPQLVKWLRILYAYQSRVSDADERHQGNWYEKWKSGHCAENILSVYDMM